MAARIDFIGQKFGRLTVFKEAESRRNPCGSVTRQYLCKCDCGQESIARVNALTSGNTTSCGCLHNEMKHDGFRRTHGHSGGKHSRREPEYQVWAAMVRRCEDVKDKRFDRYGGRGISVCRKWRESYQAFFDDVGARPTAKHTIDRIDNDGNYEPENVRWATMKEQQNNRGNNRYVVYNGERMTMTMATIKAGNIVGRNTVQARLVLGWDIKDAVEQPSRRRI